LKINLNKEKFIEKKIQIIQKKGGVEYTGV